MKFYQKSDAIKCINKSNGDNIRLIQKDIDDKGRKYFYTMNCDQLYSNIRSNNDKDKPSHYYESWTERNVLIFSLDIDDDFSSNIAFDDIIKKNILTVIKFANKFYNYVYEINNIFIIKTKKQSNKNSAHIIFRGLQFQNNNICKNFYNRMIKEDKKSLPFSDSSIYNLTCLRTCFSTKKGKNFPLHPYRLQIKDKYTASPADFCNEKEYFSQTLITTTNKIDRIINSNEIVEVEEEDVNFYFKKNDHTDEQIVELLNSLPPEYCDEYFKWNKVGMTLFSLNENYLNLYDEWSKKSKKYKKNCTKQQWTRYKNGNIDKSLLGIGSLIYWAKEGGYSFPDKTLEHTVNEYPEKKIIISNSDKFNLQTISKNKSSEFNNFRTS